MWVRLKHGRNAEFIGNTLNLRIQDDFVSGFITDN